MAGGKHNDDRFDAMLHRQMGAGRQTRRDCPDSAVLAAYHDRSLPRFERTRIDDHLGGCALCRAELVALVAAEDATPEAASGTERIRRGALGRWILSPWTAAAVAGAVVVVIAVGMGTGRFQFGAPPEPAPSNRKAKIEPRQLRPELAASAANRSQASATQRFQIPRKKSAKAPSAREMTMERTPAVNVAPSTTGSAPSTATGAAAQGAAGAGTAAIGSPGAAAELASRAPIPPSEASSLQKAAPSTAQPAWVRATVASPDGSVRWLIGKGGRVERIAAGAPPRMLHSGVGTELLAGSAPSRAVCWIVGRDGTVIRTSDGGDHWMPTTPPTGSNLVSVIARNSSSATVITADSHRYSTVDGGRTWHKQR